MTLLHYWAIDSLRVGANILLIFRILKLIHMIVRWKSEKDYSRNGTKLSSWHYLSSEKFIIAYWHLSTIMRTQVLSIDSYRGPSITTTFWYLSFGDQRLIILEVDVTLDSFPFLTHRAWNMLTRSSQIHFCPPFNLLWRLLARNALTNQWPTTQLLIQKQKPVDNV